MKYQLTLAQTVRAYGSAEVEADSFEEAVEKMRCQLVARDKDVTDWDNVTDVEWGTATEDTIVDITDENGNTLDDIELSGDDGKAHSAEDVASDVREQMGYAAA